MIGVVITSHGGLAIELLHSAQMIIGPIEKAVGISIDRQMSLETARDQLLKAVAEVGTDHDGVIILTDLFGGTPTNVAVELLQTGSADIVTGVNLPMVLKCAGGRQGKSLRELADFLKEYARDAIIRPADLLQKTD